LSYNKCIDQLNAFLLNKTNKAWIKLLCIRPRKA